MHSLLILPCLALRGVTKGGTGALRRAVLVLRALRVLRAILILPTGPNKAVGSPVVGHHLLPIRTNLSSVCIKALNTSTGKAVHNSPQRFRAILIARAKSTAFASSATSMMQSLDWQLLSTIQCIVRRATARKKRGQGDKSAQTYSAFGCRLVLLATMSCARLSL